ncbi:MAG: ABC transporter ATP-binding protein [Chloroflexi bacterium]|nr:ABC transporter ATP-binding protein [Chloroflexota bacterium]
MTLARDCRAAARMGLTAFCGRLRATRDAAVYVVGLLWRHARLPGGLLLLASAVGGAGTPVVVWAVAGLVNALAAAPQQPEAVWQAVVPWLAALLAALVVGGMEGAAVAYLATVTQVRLEDAIQRRLLEQALALDLATFERPAHYQRYETAGRALGGLAQPLRALGRLVGAMVSLAGLLVLFVRAHWLLAAVLLATVAARSVVIGLASKIRVRVEGDTSPLRREAGYWSALLASRNAAPELRLFGLGEPLLGRWQRAVDRYAAESLAAWWRVQRHDVAAHVAQEAVSWAAVFVLLLLALGGALQLGELVALFYGLAGFRGLAWRCGYSVGELVQHWGRLAHLRDFLSLAPEPRPATPAAVPRPLREGVRFRGVSFIYPGAGRRALAGIDLTLRPGERVALVGENGAGKTTLVRLLLGLYRPTEGQITVDGVDLAALDPDAWRREATAVFQDFGRYPTTAGENIGYGDPDLLDGLCAAVGSSPHPQPLSHKGRGEFVPPRIVEAAARGGADELIGSLPHGYATPLGKEFDGAVELSVGQWQRLALARAYLRDAPIVVLDEPAAALDPRAEVAVYHQFARAAAGRCAVLISHRLGSARLADRIVVLKDSRIIEEGNHESLLRQGGEYARLWSLQAGWYADASGIPDGGHGKSTAIEVAMEGNGDDGVV